jgi:hypothetical protein
VGHSFLHGGGARGGGGAQALLTVSHDCCCCCCCCVWVLQGPLATWVESETAWVMVRHLLMGFELQLYEPADYTMIYW